MYYWDNYKYCNGTNESLTKYCTKTSCGEFAFVDNKTTLDLTDDAAELIGVVVGECQQLHDIVI